MDNGVCPLNVNNSTYFNCCSIFCEDPLQDSLDAPMPWIGIYITAASALCLFIVLYDALNDLGTKRFWFPSKYFSLNSFTLTLLAIAMKLPVDLTGKMTGSADKLARITSLVFMSTAMANFMTCLGSMGNNEILLNIVSLGILVITIAVNICIRNVQMSSFDFDGTQEILVEEIVCVAVMIVLFVTLCSLSIVVPSLKKQIELEYGKVYKRSISYNQVKWGSINIDELRRVVTRYWVMAQTGSPQFVIARSVICVIPGVLCLLMASLTLLRVVSRVPSVFQSDDLGSSSSYKWSTIGILTVQSIFVALSTIAPVFRWFAAAQLKSREIGHKSLKDELEVETYWTQMLLDLKRSPFHPKIRQIATRNFALNARKLIVNFCFGVQLVIVLTNKLVLLISAMFAKVFLFCSYFSKESKEAMEQDISHYAVLLEGEGELPEKTLRHLCKEVDKLIKSLKKRRHGYIIQLLKKSVSFNGVREFHNQRVKRLLDCDDSPNCWSLAIVTLTSIAISLPNSEMDLCYQLLKSVDQGLHFVKIIEDALERDASKDPDPQKLAENVAYNIARMPGIRNAADVIWAGIADECKWKDIDTLQIRSHSESYEDALTKMSDIAQEIMKGFEMENPLSFPVEVIAADSIYHISETILQAYEDSNSRTEEQLFEILSIMISDIFSACFTNLPRVITLQCHIGDIEERDESVRQAALLLGESEDIFMTLQHRVLPVLGERAAGYIDEWRKSMEKDSENAVPSIPAATTAISNSDGEHVIEVEGCNPP